MKKMKKIFLWTIAGMLVLFIIAAIVVGLFIGNIVKAGMETIGPKVTKTTYTVDAVNVSIFTGSAAIKNLVIGNPVEYKDKAPNAIVVGSTAVRVAPLSVLSDKIVIKYVRVEAPEITFEGNPLGKNNLKKILDNANEFTASFQSAPTTNQPAKPAGKPAGHGLKLQVDELTVSGAKVYLGTNSALTLPDIHFTDLGKGPDGITPAQLTETVLSEIITGTVKAVGKDASKFVGENASGISKSIGGLFKKSSSTNSTKAK
jgi:uncharacterized protein involved in outer membrane biogenesis